jgi:hypothetical protein
LGLISIKTPSRGSLRGKQQFDKSLLCHGVTEECLAAEKGKMLLIIQPQICNETAGNGIIGTAKAPSALSRGRYLLHYSVLRKF